MEKDSGTEETNVHFDPQKQYTFLLFPEAEFSERIRQFRLQYTGSETVDSLLPHITLRKKLSPIASDSDQYILRAFENFSLANSIITLRKIEIYGNALVLSGENPEICKAHRELLSELTGKTTPENPDIEGANYGIHLTLLRLDEGMDLDGIKQEAATLLEDFKVRTLSIFEMLGREFSREILSKNIG